MARRRLLEQDAGVQHAVSTIHVHEATSQSLREAVAQRGQTVRRQLEETNSHHKLVEDLQETMNRQTRKHGSWDLDMASLDLGKLSEAWHDEQWIRLQVALSKDRQGALGRPQHAQQEKTEPYL